jgi:hypothetical protein
VPDQATSTLTAKRSSGYWVFSRMKLVVVKLPVRARLETWKPICGNR